MGWSWNPPRIDTGKIEREGFRINMPRMPSIDWGKIEREAREAAERVAREAREAQQHAERVARETHERVAREAQQHAERVERELREGAERAAREAQRVERELREGAERAAREAQRVAREAEEKAAQIKWVEHLLGLDRIRKQREKEQREREEAERQRLAEIERQRLAAIEAERQRLAEIERQRLAAIEAEKRRLAKEKADRESNVDWLTAQIEKLRVQIRGENNIIVGEQTNIGNTNVLIDKGNFDIKKLLEQLQREKNKGSAYDQGDFEIQNLTKQVLECNNKISKHKSEFDESIKIIQTSTNNLKNLAEKYDLLFKDNSSETKLLFNVEKLKQLNDGITKLKLEIDDAIIKINGDKTNVNELNEKITTLNNRISELDLIDYSNKVYNSKNILDLTQNVDTSLNFFFSYLKTKNTNPELTYGKIKYREIEHQKLNNFNKLLDVLFYCFYFVFILIMIYTGNIKREHFLVYIFIGLIPILFPILIKITKNINIGFDIFNGEKNAFIENEEYIDAYNI